MSEVIMIISKLVLIPMYLCYSRRLKTDFEKGVMFGIFVIALWAGV